MYKFRNNNYLYKKVFNLLSNNNNHIIQATNEITNILDNHGYRIKTIKTKYYDNAKYSLGELYGKCDIVINDCSLLSNEEINKMVDEIKNNNLYTWIPHQVIIDTKQLVMTEDQLKFIRYTLEDSLTNKEKIILQKL